MMEEALQIEAARRDPAQFRPLYEKYYSTIFRFVYRRVDDKELTADLTSQVFLQALMHLPRYEVRAVPFSAWLYRIATNEVLQFFRKQNRVGVVRQVMIGEELVSELHEEGEEKERLVERLALTLEKLSEQEVQLIELRFYEQMSFRDIGYTLRITENNAKVRTYRLLEKMKKYMLGLS